MQIYVVKENDTVDRIGADFGISPYALAWANQIEPPYCLAVGQALFLPDGFWRILCIKLENWKESIDRFSDHAYNLIH